MIGQERTGDEEHRRTETDGLTAALELVGQRWALLVVRALLAGPRRYGDLQRELGAPTNILATRLRELQEAGVVVRVPLAHNALAYGLTERGAGLLASIEALEAWGAAGEDRLEPPRVVGDGRAAPRT